MRVRAAALIVAAMSAAAVTAQETDWRRVATKHDRVRLRGWRAAWVEAIGAVRRGGAGSTLSADAALYDPDRALGDAMPPVGAYRCRTVKLGGRGLGTQPYVGHGWSACRIDDDASGGRRLVKLDGAQRIDGTILPDGDTRAVFLGALVLGDERGAMRYGRDAARDMAGLVERIGPARWRLVLPYPRFESTLDIVELVPTITRL